MGTQNRQRRRAKQRQNKQRRRGGTRATAPRTGPATDRGDQPSGDDRRRPPSDPFAVRDVVGAAVMAFRLDDEESYTELLDRLDEGRAVPGGRRQVATVLDTALAGEVRRAWARGWQPADLVRVMGRRLGSHHVRYVTDIIATDAARYAGTAVDRRWTEQLEDFGARTWWSEDECHLEQWTIREGLAGVHALAVAVEVLSLLGLLPELPRLSDPPGEPGHAPRTRRRPDEHDGRMLVRVRALLAKAESTTFAEEAEALSAKAQELMARYAIDVAMVDGGNCTDGDVPVGARLGIDDPYASAKSLLLAEVASANGCRAVWSRELALATVFGFETEVEFVELLYTSLLVQATSAMSAAGGHVDRLGRSRTRSFRQSFLVAYATRIGQRLRAAEASSRASAAQEYGDALLPVLADRSAAVDEAFDAVFSAVRTYSVSTTNHAGWAAGSAAADLASLSVRPEVPADSA